MPDVVMRRDPLCVLFLSLQPLVLATYLGGEKTQLIALKVLSLRSALESRGPKVPEFQWDVFLIGTRRPPKIKQNPRPDV